MTLVISPRGTDDDVDFDGDTSFGFERYRSELWGSPAVRATGATLIPMLDGGNTWVDNWELDDLEAEARTILDQVDEIAHEVFGDGPPAEGAVVVDGQLHDAYGGRSRAESIERYLANLLRCIGLAREHDCGLVIW